MDDVNYYLGLHPLGAVAIVVSTTLLYLAFVVFLRASSQRLFSSPSSFELAVATVLGAVSAGRSSARCQRSQGACSPWAPCSCWRSSPAR